MVFWRFCVASFVSEVRPAIVLTPIWVLLSRALMGRVATRLPYGRPLPWPCSGWVGQWRVAGSRQVHFGGGSVAKIIMGPLLFILVMLINCG